ncbi:MAG: aromatic ring-hydroxylating oxygenase subunit alpha [Microthrixaceae bacterium]
MTDTQDTAAMVPMHDPEVLLEQARKMLELHQAGTTTLAEEVYRQPVSTYLDDARAVAERRELFMRTPQVACMSCELPEVGSQVALRVADVPVLVVRDESGDVQGFLNSCRHRASTVLEGRDCGRRMVCPYHGWTYDLGGTLVGLPGAEGFEGLDREQHGLVPVEVEERHGLVWVTLESGGPSLDEHLGPLGEELDRLNLGELHHHETREIRSNCNWKLAMDTNTESYHFPALHKDSIGPFTMGNLNVFEPLGRSLRLTFSAVTLPMLADQSEEQWRPQDHLQFVYLIHPNVSLLVTGDHAQLFRIHPDGAPDRAATWHGMYSRVPLDNADAELTAAGQFELFHGVVRDEDMPCAETIQTTLASGANTHLSFGRNEPALHHLHRGYDDALADSHN